MKIDRKWNINQLYLCIFIFFRAIVGELDDEVDARLDLSTIRADPLSSIVH